MSGVAERLYYDSPELEFTAKVTDIRLQSQTTGEDGSKEQVWQVALDRTAFYPESGGQPWDTGVLVAVARSGATLEVPVDRVEEDEAGEVWHAVRKPLLEGAEITGRISAQRRIDHMQQHTGQHLLSAVFLNECGAKTVSFHLGAESSTIDLALPEDVQKLSAEQLLRVEAQVNRLIFEDRHITPKWVTREESEAMLARGELRKLPEREGPMRIVEMEGVEFNACGGTHVKSTGAIGGLLLRRVEKVKQGWRVEFVCGQRAVSAARRDYEMLGKTAASLSVGSADVPARVNALVEEVKAAGKVQRGLLGELAKFEAEKLVANALQDDVVSSTFTDRDVEFAKLVASHAVSHGRTAVVGAKKADIGAVVLGRRATKDLHAGNMLREVLSAAGARGGGSAEMAQGICRPDQVEQLVAALVDRLGS